MSSKITPESLYLKDLRKKTKSINKSLDHATANKLFKNLSLSERERYIILSRQINESNAVQNAGNYTTQKDTIGINLKDVNDNKLNLGKWKQSVSENIKKITENENAIERSFVVAEVNGVFFTKPNEHLDSYVASEIVFTKFNFKNGVINSLVLFPDCLKISLGYRESLYEDLEESVGWRPDTFKDNELLHNCSNKIRDFFSGGYEPIYVESENQLHAVGVALYNLYSEIGQRCPWLHSLSDWGQHCLIYGLEDLIVNIINKKNPVDKPQEAISVMDVRDHWLKMNQNMATYCCERHQQHGQPNQCAHNIVTKNLYSSFIMVQPCYKEEIPDIRALVSTDFIDNIRLVVEPASLPVVESSTYSDHQRQSSTIDRWAGYVLDHLASVEEVISGIEAIAIREDGTKRQTERLGATKSMGSGRGRGTARDLDKGLAPGQVVRKYKLPKVVC